MEEKKSKKYLDNVEPRLKEIQAWARDGVIEEDIAKLLNISYSTFREYKSKYSALSAVLKCARTYDDEVVYALHKNTLGGIVDLKVPVKCKRRYYDDRGKLIEEEYVVDAIKQEYIKPDTMAQMYWLNNRVPEKWKAKQTTSDGLQDNEIKVTLEVKDVSGGENDRN